MVSLKRAALIGVAVAVLLVVAALALGQPAPPGPPRVPPDPTDRRTLTVTKSGTGAGTVAGPGINCGADCTEPYIVGTTTVIHAVPAFGSTFTGWSGACTGTGACSVPMTQAQNVTATFTVQVFALTVTKVGAGTGTVTSTPTGISCGSDCAQDYAYGTAVSLAQSAAAGSSFTGWSGACSGTGTCSVTMTQARTVGAGFSSATFPLTVTLAGSGTGSVTSSPAGITCGADCSEPYAADLSVTLTQAATGGSSFAGWSGACTGTGACVVVMSQAQAVTATFNSAPVAGCTETVNPDQPSVNAAIGRMSPTVPSTICLNAGAPTWTAGVTINKPITLRGVSPCTPIPTSADNNLLGRPVPTFTACPTQITINTPAGVDLITLSPSSTPGAGTIRVQDISFRSGTGPTPSTSGAIKIIGSSTTNPVVIRRNLFTILFSTTAIYSLNPTGVVSGNTFQGVVSTSSCLNSTGAIRLKPSASAIPWASAATYGASQNFYVEDNTLRDMHQNDGDDASRWVWRGNHMYNSHIGSHGLDSSPVGARHREIYYNRFTWGPGFTNGGTTCTTCSNFQDFIGGRGGTGLHFGNDLQAQGGCGYTFRHQRASIWVLDIDNANQTAASCWGNSSELNGESYPAPHQAGWGWNPAGSGGTGGCAPHICPKQVGSLEQAQWPQDPEPIYSWLNDDHGHPTGPTTQPIRDQGGPHGTHSCVGNGPSPATYLRYGRDIITPTDFSATEGPARTTVSATAPSGACTDRSLMWVTGEGVWRTGVAGTHGRAYKCVGGTWQLFYTPYTYPHDLAASP
jgi:hypothetical protein